MGVDITAGIHPFQYTHLHMTHSAVYMPNAEMLCQHVMLSSQMQTNLSYIDDYRNEIYMKTPSLPKKSLECAMCRTPRPAIPHQTS